MLRVEVIGNIGGDAIVKDDNGRKYAQFSVADSRRFKKSDGTESEVTNWVSCFMRNVDAAVMPYLKRGTRVYVRGNGELRLFSSAKDRRMKAGLSINVSEIELVGGSTDSVPRQLAFPSTGRIVPVAKYYWVNLQGATDQEKVNYCLYDQRGNPYPYNDLGFISVPNQQQQQMEEAQADESAGQVPQQGVAPQVDAGGVYKPDQGESEQVEVY